jgi:hypothetical protein
MITIPVQLTEELAERVRPVQDRLPEIIELGLRQLHAKSTRQVDSNAQQAKHQVLMALASTKIVTLPQSASHQPARMRRTPISAGGPPASELIIAERRQGYETN